MRDVLVYLTDTVLSPWKCKMVRDRLKMFLHISGYEISVLSLRYEYRETGTVYDILKESVSTVEWKSRKLYLRVILVSRS
jgi:hypothetical protein